MAQSIKSYRDLIARQKSMDLALAVYKQTAKLPPEERFGLTAGKAGEEVQHRITSVFCETPVAHSTNCPLRSNSVCGWNTMATGTL